MSTLPEPSSCSPTRSSGRCSAWATTVSTWPTSSALPAPVPCRRATRSSAWPGEEHGTRSIVASPGSSAVQTDAHSLAPWTSPLGLDTATSASSSRGARLAISAAASLIHGSIASRLT